MAQISGAYHVRVGSYERLRHRILAVCCCLRERSRPVGQHLPLLLLLPVCWWWWSGAHTPCRRSHPGTSPAAHSPRPAGAAPLTHTGGSPAVGARIYTCLLQHSYTCIVDHDYSYLPYTHFVTLLLIHSSCTYQPIMHHVLRLLSGREEKYKHGVYMRLPRTLCECVCAGIYSAM